MKTSTRRLLKRPLYRVAVIAVALTSMSFGVQANPGMPPAVVHTAMVEQTEIAPVIWRNGVIKSRNNSAVASRTGGQLQWLVEQGDVVQKGDKLLQISDPLLKLTVEQKKATIRQHQARIGYLGSEVKRLNTLAKKQNAAKSELDLRTSELESTKANLAADQASLKQSQRQLEFTELKAPFSGVVSERLAQVGEVVQPGSAVVRLVDTYNKDIEVKAPLSAWQYVAEGMQLTVKSVAGTALLPIRKIVPVGDQRTRMMLILVDAQSIDWPVGLDVKVEVPQGGAKAGLMVPRDALVLRRGEVAVYVINAEGIARKVVVKESFGSGANIMVEGELNAGDEVVIRGNERLRQGMKVQTAESNDLVELQESKS